MMPTFGLERPELAWLLLLAVPVVWLALRSRRQLSRRRMMSATAVRLLLLLSLVLSIAGLTWYRPADALGVVFVLDRSASVDPAARLAAEKFVTEALKSQGDEDLAGVVVFGGAAYVDVQPRAELQWHGVEVKTSPHNSDLAAGVRLASALLPSDRTGRIVLLSDGEETRGDVATQVLLTSGTDVEVAVVPLERATGPDARLEDLLTPSRIDEGAAYEIRVVARAAKPGPGKIRLYRNDEYLGELPVQLTGDRADVFSVRQEASTPGLYRYRAVLEVDDPSNDVVPQNNEVVSTVQVTGRPRVLYAEGIPGEDRYLREVMEAQGFVVDVVRPEEMPPGAAGLRAYSAVVLSDVPAWVLTRRQQEALHSYVRDLGRGLVMLGGDKSFGLGGYYQTPIEQALPVRVDLKDKTRFPKLAMVIALDKSCSMGEGAGTPLGMAKEAGIQTVELLSSRDMLGVIGFDGAATFIVPLQTLDDKAPVRKKIAQIRSGGGTDIYPALDRSFKSLRQTDAALKHVVLLSDGMTSGADYQTLIEAAAKEHVTVTSLAIGQGADQDTMKKFAKWGQGNFYYVTDSNAIPAIFTRETMLASRSFLVEESFRAKAGSPSDLTRGLSASAIPQLDGYVATEAKPRAVVPLLIPGKTADQPDLPLLAHWRHGLGRSVAYTSDARSKWSKNFVGTEAYTQLFAQTMRWTVGDATDANLDVSAEIRDGELIVTVDAFDEQGDFKNFLDGEARVVAPDLTVHPLNLQQVSPGRYEAAVPVDQDGSWLVGVSLAEGEQVVGQSVVEAVQPYSPEYRSHGAGASVLSELGKLGGGGVLTSPEQAFTRPVVPRDVPKPLAAWLMGLSTLLLLLDIAVRRLELPGRRGPQRAVAVTDVARAAAAPKRQAPKARGDKPADDLHVEAPAAVEDILPEQEAAPTIDEDSYVGGLLAARKKAKSRTRKK